MTPLTPHEAYDLIISYEKVREVLSRTTMQLASLADRTAEHAREPIEYSMERVREINTLLSSTYYSLVREHAEEILLTPELRRSALRKGKK
jgi:hypothetical protein